MSGMTFRRGARMFPVRYQPELDLAAFEFRQVAPDSRFYNRARAWLGYTAMTAIVDGWSYSDKEAWGDLARFRPKRLAREAQQLAQDALADERASTDKEFVYDIRWALAFIAIHRHKFTKAKNQIDRAVQFKKPDHSHPDPALFAEAADIYVFLGIPGADVDPSVQSYRGSIAMAFSEVGDKVPDWFYWVRGWTHFADAAQLTANRSDEEAALDLAIADLKKVIPDVNKLRQPHDFDACAVLAAALQKRGDTEDAYAAWEALLDQMWELRSIAWSVKQEMDRAPFDTSNEIANTIQEYFQKALEAIPDDPIAAVHGESAD